MFQLKFSILTNGDPQGLFSSQRGLRQGDPLSPYLFVLVMEILNTMLRKAERLGWTRGLKICRLDQDGMMLSLIMRADGSLPVKLTKSRCYIGEEFFYAMKLLLG